MAHSWQNPNYESEWRRHRSRIIVACVLLAAVLLAASLLVNRGDRFPVDRHAAAAVRSAKNLPREQGGAVAPYTAHFASAEQDGASVGVGSASAGLAAPAGATSESQGVSFAAHKALAISLYRQNDLPGAQEQAQAALSMQRDDELIELLMRIDREIRVQRDYDNARTANFIVLFDGYEHEEIKHTVLGILKEAYADIGKELDTFPEEPVTVILYTGKDFSDVTRAPDWAGGMFGKVDGKIRVPVQGAEAQERALRRVLYHEYVHALLHSLAAHCPLWLHEGLAQYLSGERGVSVGQVIPLPMLAVGFPNDARAAHVAYMESLQAVSDLVSERGMASMRRLLNGLGSGKGIEEAFAAAYGQPFSRWAASWRPVEHADAGETESER